MKNKRIINYDITQDQFCYLAGFMDAGSSFMLTQQRAGRKDKETGLNDFRWVSGFTIQHTNTKMIEHFTQLLFLGDSHTHIINIVGSGHAHRPIKAIRVTGQILDYIIPRLLPFLIIKKEHAQIICDFRKTVGDYGSNNPIPMHIHAYRIELKEKMKYLNSKNYKDMISSPLSPSTVTKCC